MRRFDFTFTEEERVAILTGVKSFPHSGAFSEVLLASGSNEQPAKPMVTLFQHVFEELDDDYPDQWEVWLTRAYIDLQAEGRTTMSWVLAALRKEDGKPMAFQVMGETVYALAFNFNEQWRLDGFSTISKEELAEFRFGGGRQ